MIDLFGIKKDGETQESAPPAAAPAARGRNKLWGVLLVVDSVFVIVFGGAVAAKLYHHWKAPASAPRAPARGKTPTPSAAPKVEAKVEAKAPEPAKPEPPKADTKTAEKAPEPPKASGPKSARPSLVAEPPKGRQAPQPQAAAPEKQAAKPAEPAAAEAKAAKAQPVDFRFRSPKAKHVQLAGAFIVRGGGRKDMVHQSDGSWTLTLYLKPDTYRYNFIVDGKKALDPDNPKVERGASVVTISP